MSSRSSKKRKDLKIVVSFEASRVASECLACAYEQVVPLASRTTRDAGSQLPLVHSEPNERTVEEVSLFDGSDSGYCDSVTNSNRRVAT